LYSPFVSTYFSPDEYESKLIAATRARELAVKQLNWREGNPKRVREHLELRAESGGIREWKQYLSWELGAKKPQKRLIMSVYERAVECAARERWNALINAAKTETQAAKEAVTEKETALRELWEEYVMYAVSIFPFLIHTFIYRNHVRLASSMRIYSLC
jgi:squamous cell carcinoma antigen recognized by T-cells 3